MINTSIMNSAIVFKKMKPIGALLFGFALVLRLLMISYSSFWIDEVIQITAAGILTEEGLFAFMRYENLPPLSHLINALVIDTLGDSELAVRLPSAIFGALTAFFVYRATLKLFDFRSAVVAGLMTALSPFLLWYSQEARMYAMTACAAAVALDSYAHIIKEGRASFSALMVFGAMSVTGFLLHPYYLLSVPAFLIHAAIVFGIRSRNFRNILFSQVAVVIVVAMWVGATLSSFVSTVSSQGYAKLHNILFFVPYAFYTLLFGHTLGPSIADAQSYSSIQLLVRNWPVLVATLTMVAGATVHVWLHHRNRSRERTLLLLLLLLVSPVLLSVVIAGFTGIGFNARYVIAATPPMMMIVSLALAGGKRRNRTSVFGICLVGLMLWSVVNYYTSSEYRREDIRSVAGSLSTEVSSSTVLIVSSATVMRVLRYYGLQLPERTFAVHSADDVYLDGLAADLESAVAPDDTILFLESRAWESDREGRVRSLLAGMFTTITSIEYVGATVTTYSAVAHDTHMTISCLTD